MIELILGGARSGKSHYAQSIANDAYKASKNIIYVATAMSIDDEMAARIARHQADRPDEWALIESPLNLPKTIHAHSNRENNLLLIDCLTLWINNELYKNPDLIFTDICRDLEEALNLAKCDIILVSNEVGMGITPMGKETRKFVDWQGWLNQAVAKNADNVTFIAAGLPISLKKLVMTDLVHTIYLLRHGAVNGPPALYGSTDVPLSNMGWQQLDEQSRKIEGLTQIISSPLRRCHEFAKTPSQKRNINLTLEKDLRECHFGKWDGVPFDEVPYFDWPDLNVFWQSPATCQFEGAEMLADMQTRVVYTFGPFYCETTRHSKTPKSIIDTWRRHPFVGAHILASTIKNAALYQRLKIDYASLSKINCPTCQNAMPTVEYVAVPAKWGK